MSDPKSGESHSHSELDSHVGSESEVISKFTLDVCNPLCWHDRALTFPKKVRGASCFILRFRDRLVGVTAAHVLEEFKLARRDIPGLVCQLRLMPFDPVDATIDSDAESDIATFGLTERELELSECVPIDCRLAWPPPPPRKLRALSLAGYPEEQIVTSADKSAVFNAYGALTTAEDVSADTILVSYSPDKAKKMGDVPLPPVDINLSGCSGGPVLMHGMENGLLRWYPAGIIIAGPRREKSDPGELEKCALMRVRRIDVLQEDGTIKRDDHPAGWLP